MTILVILSAVSLLWLSAHLFELYPLSGQFVQRDPDSVLFTRLLEQSILKGKVQEYDNYSCYPYEIRHGFGPFYLWFLYHAVLVFFSIFPKCEIDPIKIAGMLPVIFTWLTSVMLLYTISRLSKRMSFFIFCCFFMLPCGAVKFISSYMLLDYDFLISFLIWLWICSYLLALGTGEKFWQYTGCLAAIVLPATWTGSPLFFLFVTIYGFYLWLADQKDVLFYLEFAFSTMLTGAAINLIMGLRIDMAGEMFSIAKYSFFQPLCIALGGVSCYLLSVLKNKSHLRIYGLLGLAGACALLAVVFREQLLQVSGFLFQKDQIHKTISEMLPSLQLRKLIYSHTNIKDVLSYFGYGIVLFPLFVFLRWECLEKPQESFLRYWITLMLLLTFNQIRYIRWLTVGSGIFLAVSYHLLWRIMNREFACEKRRIVLLLLFFLPVLVLQSVPGFFINLTVPNLPKEQIEAFSWIRENTPETSGYYDDKKPEYGILSYWDEGNFIGYYARRPSVVNNAMWGYKTMADVFSAKTEDEAFSLCEKYQIRYIYMSTFRIFSEGSYKYWSTLKNAPERPEYLLNHDEKCSDDNPEDFFYQWLRTNLALTPRAGFKTGSHFRLVYGAKGDSQTMSPFILFEKVAGARLNLAKNNASEVVVSIGLMVGEIEFMYKKSCLAKDMTEVILPYSTGYSKGRVSTDPFYKISIKYSDGSQKLAKLLVAESEIQLGREVSANIEIVGRATADTK